MTIGGVELATSLLPLILNRGSLLMSVKPSCAGTPYFVNFILQTPSGNSFHFTGRPDFTVDDKPCHYVLRYRARAVGETQSPPDQKKNPTRAKQRALSQAGVYAVGQLSSLVPVMPAIVLFKDKTAQVAIASINSSSSSSSRSLGKVSFKFIDENIYPLNNPTELKAFARIFCGCVTMHTPTPTP